jgi:outer membrane lipoprotein-sorting protein
MRFLHRLSTRRLVAVCAAVATVAGGTAAIAVAATGGGPTPPAKPLAPAIHDALAAPKPAGLTARISFTNDLIGASSLRNGASPILTGATGRLWLGDDGRVRLELQSDAGDAQIVSDGRTLRVFDASSNTVYEADLPASEDDGGKQAVPSVADIQKRLEHVMGSLDVTGPQPGDIAGRPAYTVRIAPQHDGGLLGAAAIAWDAANGTPLRAAVYAQGQSDPVLELEVTDISYGPVAASTFAPPDAPGAKVVHLSATSMHPAGGKDGAGREVSGRDAVASQLGFPLAAPDQLVGLPRHDVRLIDSGDAKAALVTYGKGLGGIVVIEQAAKDGSDPFGGRDDAFPKVSIDGATGTEIATALGTIVRFTRGDVTYTVLGSVPPAAAEAAARAL